MKNYSAKEIKNIVLIGAPGTGKTTLAEAMAFEGKVIDRRGSIEANNTLSDNTDIEHEYKRSIYSTILFTEFMDRKLNIIDCPGSDDFCGSLFSAFKVGDVGVFLFNAQNGWEVGSEIQARYARLLQKPVIGVVNQLDADKANFEAAVESIRASSRVKPVIVQYPVNQGPEFNAFIDVLLMKMYRFKDNDGHREELEIPAEELDKAQELNKELVEMAAEHDEALMELYFDKGTLTQDDIRAGLKIGLSKREVMPIFCTSGKRDIGTKRLMEFIINVAPGPLKAPNFLSTDGEEIAADETAPAVAFVFKSQVEQHIGEITYFRVIRGRIAEGTELVNTRTGNKEKVSQLFAVAGKNRIKVTELMAGDIGCTVKLKGSRTNDTLAAPSAPVTVEPIVFPEPRYRAAVKAKEQGDEEKLGKVLNDAKFEDPTILVEYSKELKQTIIQGQGEHHLNILRTRIEKENRLQYDYIAPKIPYRETITKVAQADYRHKKQSDELAQKNIHQVILDLRYNKGGSIDCTQLLSTILVSSFYLDQTMAFLEYNDKNTAKDATLIFNSDLLGTSGGKNLDLTTLIVLISGETAGAPEMLMHSLNGKIQQLIAIGSSTKGQNVATEQFINEEFLWSINPAVCTIYNSEHDTYGGFKPTYAVNASTDYLTFLPFGDEKETLLSVALGVLNKTYPPKDEETEETTKAQFKIEKSVISPASRRFSSNGLRLK